MSTDSISVTYSNTLDVSLGMSMDTLGNVYVTLPDVNPIALLRMCELLRSEIQRQSVAGSLTSVKNIQGQFVG